MSQIEFNFNNGKVESYISPQVKQAFLRLAIVGGVSAALVLLGCGPGNTVAPEISAASPFDTSCAGKADSEEQADFNNSIPVWKGKGWTDAEIQTHLLSLCEGLEPPQN